VVQATSLRYLDAFERLTGTSLADVLGAGAAAVPPQERRP
jgi:hypothetical protein